MTSDHFSAEVRAHLARRRLTVADLAAHLGISEATIYRRLNQGSSWPLDEAVATAAFFEVPITSMTGSAA